MSTVADLWALQQTDLTVDVLRHRLSELERLRGETPELLAARQAVADATLELNRWQQRQQTLDTQVHDLAERVRAAQKDLLSGRVRNPKELEGMEANVQALNRRLSALEDEALQAMLKSEEWQIELAAHQAALAQAESAWHATQDAVGAELGQLAAKLKHQAALLGQEWEILSPQDKELYRGLRSRKGGRAIALEQDGICQACGMALPTGQIQAVHRGDERVVCLGCGRLLYAP